MLWKKVSSTNAAGKTGYPHVEGMKLDLCLSPCTKINSKWIRDFHIRPKALKQFQEAVGNTLE
jgi:hypothetical protein